MVKSEMLSVHMRNECECPNTPIEFRARLQSIHGDIVLILPLECITFGSVTSQEGDMAKVYDLEARPLRFSKAVFSYVHRLPITVTNTETSKQLVRSAASIGANYGEANEALGRKDFLMGLRIARKEAKETQYWIELAACSESEAGIKSERADEANLLMRIFGAIITTFEPGIPKKIES